MYLFFLIFYFSFKFVIFYLKAVNANVVRSVCMKYIYDKDPAIAGVGE